MRIHVTSHLGLECSQLVVQPAHFLVLVRQLGLVLVRPRDHRMFKLVEPNLGFSELTLSGPECRERLFRLLDGVLGNALSILRLLPRLLQLTTQTRNIYALLRNRAEER